VSIQVQSDHRIEAVVFDLGGVLLDWDPRYLYRTLFSDGVQMDFFLEKICTPQWHDAHDRGVPTGTSCADLATRYPEWAEPIRAWGERSEEMLAGSFQASVDILHDLKTTGLRCYALTNMEAETYPLRLRRFEFLNWFDGTVVSAYEGIAKPDREIFVRLLDRYDLAAASTLMIDDTLENIEVAQKMGMVTHHFHSAQLLRNFLDSRSLLPK
jgi:2-haloacid dehalogenase